jgi:hypothetical protein
MAWTRRSLVAAAAGVAAAPAAAWAYPADAAMWEVRQGRAKVLVFGDSGPLQAPWASARFTAALNASAVFWKETPDPGPGANAVFMAKGIDPARPLATWLTADERARVAAAATSVGLAPVLLDRLRPWLASVFLDSSFRTHFGFKDENGPAHALSAAARAAGKPVRTEFPDEAAIVDYFAGFSRAAEVGALLRAVDEIEAGPQAAQRAAQAWAVGDLRPLIEEVGRLSRSPSTIKRSWWSGTVAGRLGSAPCWTAAERPSFWSAATTWRGLTACWSSWRRPACRRGGSDASLAGRCSVLM